MGGITLPSFLANVSLKRFQSESFIILDIGTFNVKALYIEEKSGRGEIVAHAFTQHVSSDINADGSFNVSGIMNTCRQALDKLRKASAQKRIFPKKVLLNIGGGFVFGKTLNQTYIRERPQEEIDERELGNIIQKVQQRSYEQIRKYFQKETARSELEVHIISADVQEVKIDGYQVVSPMGFKGKEIGVSLFNSYIPKLYLTIFQGIITDLRLELLSIVSGPYSVFRLLSNRNVSLTDLILVDIGGSITEIAITRKGKLEDVKSVPLGGSSFTKSISDTLKVGFWEAENIKRRFARGLVSGQVAKKLEAIIAKDVELFIRGLEVVLSEFSQLSLLPSRIYVYGGGSEIPSIGKFLRKTEWRDTLSFFANPTIEKLSPSAIVGVGKESETRSFLQPTGLEHAFWTVPFAIADTFLQKDVSGNEMNKALKRSLRLIQE